MAQCEVLQRGDGPSPDERVGTQLRLGYQAPGLQNGSTPVPDLVRWEWLNLTSYFQRASVLLHKTPAASAHCRPALARSMTVGGTSHPDFMLCVPLKRMSKIGYKS